MTFVNHRCTGGFTYFALHFIHATFCIEPRSKITPQGKVSTFAGRGSASLNGNPWGYVDGDLRQEARFDRPKGIAYDEATDTYYIGDGSNRRIRKIAYEGEE